MTAIAAPSALPVPQAPPPVFDPIFDPDYCRGLLTIAKPHLLVAAIQQQALAWQVAHGIGHVRACQDAAVFLHLLLMRLSDFNRALPIAP